MKKSIFKGILRVSLIMVLILSISSSILIFFIRYRSVYYLSKTEKNVSELSSGNLRTTILASIQHRTENMSGLIYDTIKVYTDVAAGCSLCAQELYNDNYIGEIKISSRELKKSRGASHQIFYADDADPDSPQIKNEVRMLSVVAEYMKDILYTYSEISNVYLATETGISIQIDAMPELKYDEKGRRIPFEPRERFWYTKAKEAGESSFIFSREEKFSKKPTFTWTAPFYGKDGSFKGAVAFDMYLDAINDMMADSGSLFQTERCAIIDGDGSVIYSSVEDGLLKLDTKNWTDLRRCDNSALAFCVNNAILGRSGSELFNLEGERCFVGYSPIGIEGASVIMVLPQNNLSDATGTMVKKIHTITHNQREGIYRILWNGYCRIFVLVIILFLFIFILSGTLSNKYVRSINLLSDKVKHLKGDDLDFTWEEKAEYEVERIAKSFLDLTGRIKNYIIDATELAASRERSETELAVASNLQKSMLPDIDSVHPRDNGYDLCASLKTAREVGGDLYDFFYIDDGHLCIVVADVSDKGVPAALFMVEAKSLINNAAMAGGTPEEILFATNNRLCQNNKENMFVTAWLGIFDIKSGIVCAVNAGHEYPVLKEPDGKFEIIEDEHSFVMGGMEGITYQSYTFELKKGSALFLYTDGVTDATSVSGERFGSDRMVEVLNLAPESSCKELLGRMNKGIKDFSSGAAQFDDITMLALKRIA